MASDTSTINCYVWCIQGGVKQWRHYEACRNRIELKKCKPCPNWLDKEFEILEKEEGESPPSI